ncbi:MAG: 6-bladed beta-propeller [Planctomycetes bacterium]|nr:6-bladed beta-propeller [Planctomycetota bacterium]
MNRINCKNLVETSAYVLILISLIMIPSLARSEENYVFERMWPVLQSNWYFNNPSGLAVDNNGRVYITDLLNHRIQVFTVDGVLITMWGSRGEGDGEFNYPNGVTIDQNNNLYITDTNNCRIQKMDANGVYITKWGASGEGDGEFLFPSGIATDGVDYVYVVDQHRHDVQKFDLEGTFIEKWGRKGSGEGEFNFEGAVMYPGIVLDSDNNIYISDYSNYRVQKFDSEGNFLKSWGERGSGDGQFSTPTGIAVDENNNIYVLDAGGNDRIQKFDKNGAFLDQIGPQNFGGDLLDIVIYQNRNIFFLMEGTVAY